VIEVEVHQRLRAFLREQGEPYWPHHLTMARLVARAMRCGRSALIQAGAPTGYHARYRISYLVPALMWMDPVMLVVPEPIQQRLLRVEIPRLRQWISTPKAIHTGDRPPGTSFQGLMITSPAAWLQDRLGDRPQFPDGVVTILDGVDDLEDWAQTQLTATLAPADWEALCLAFPLQADAIQNTQACLLRVAFHHPTNPYERYRLEAEELDCLHHLWTQLQDSPGFEANLPPAWTLFWEQIHHPDRLVLAAIARDLGQVTLSCVPVEVASALSSIWQRQPVVLIGGALDLDADAAIYRQRLGLGEVTCLKFAPDRQNEFIHLYAPDGIPLPNTPEFQAALIQELRSLLLASSANPGLTVLLVEDLPLKAQVASVLASEFGSRVQVERTCLEENGILVSGWDFWRQHQAVFPAPHLLVIATLPLPSLEDPVVAGRVGYYKQTRQDWFRLYLLPEALSELQRAIAPVRESQGVVALLDNRVNHRSYGQQVFAALSPSARIQTVDAALFAHLDYSL
jgi:ATP-dependent DNA helicase DinG